MEKGGREESQLGCTIRESHILSLSNLWNREREFYNLRKNEDLRRLFSKAAFQKLSVSKCTGWG